MARVAKQNESSIAIIGWFEHGNTGTINDISWSLNISDEIVTEEVRKMYRRGEVRVVGRGGGVTIYGEGDIVIKRDPVDVGAAISAQPDLVRLWNSK